MFRLLVTLLAMASALRLAHAQPRAPRMAPPMAPPMGMFVAWAQKADKTDLGGREANLRAWEERLGLPASSLLALDFYGNETWAEMFSANWVPGYWARRNPDRKLIWSIHLTMKGTPLKEVAEGRRDAEFREAARVIAASQPDAVIRIGWEMNGDWFAWAAAGKEAEYIAAWRHVAAIFRTASARFSFDWCPNWGANNMPADRAYPGDDVVDTIGVDVYDTPSGKSALAHWREDVLETPFGLRWLEEFSARHDKKMTIGEWGVGLKGGQDNPFFVDHMAQWLRANAARIAYHVYFDVPPHDLDSDAFPLSRQRFIADFAARAKSPR